MNTLVHTSSTAASNSLRLARVAAAGRVTDARRTAEAKFQADYASYMAEGQMLSREGYIEWCFICRRATDHTGEHTPEEIAAWATPPECAHDAGVSEEGRCYDCDRRVGWGRLPLIEAGLVAY